MSFLNPLLLLGALGIALPILAHLLNKHQYKTTKWAAMQFLNRNVRVRSRQIKLRDLLLLLLRCLAVLALIVAVAKPITEDATSSFASLGESRTGVIIALDASYSMQHNDDQQSRFDKALEKVASITENIFPGDPVTLVMLGAEHRVVARNMAYDAGRFQTILDAQKARAETLDMDSVPRRLKALANEMDAPQKEIYFISDMQKSDWSQGPDRLRDAFADLSQDASTIFIPITGSAENVGITSLELVSGVLRKDTVARYRATVRNYGKQVAINVIVKGMVNNINVDTKTIPSIAPGATETVSLFVPFHNAGAAQISAALNDDALLTDNTRRTVATIREKVSVLCVEGSPDSTEGFNGFVAAALRGEESSKMDFSVTSIPWISLPAQNIESYDVVVLADVPAITPDQARQLDSYVRKGNGLIWFAGDNIKPEVWNKRSALEGSSLLPAVIEQTVGATDANATGRPLDPSLPDHIVCKPLLSLSDDLLSSARFQKIIQVKPAANSVTVLSLAGNNAPLLIEHSVGRGQVFMFTTSADPSWNNMAVTPIFPMLLQQMVTYLTAREFERPRLVGHSLALSFVDQPDANDAVFDTPSGETITVPVLEQRGQYVAMLDHAHEAGFYLARVSVQAPGTPIAVNVDTSESRIAGLKTAELRSRFDGSDVMFAESDEELIGLIDSTRTSLSFWRLFMIACLVLLILETLLADRLQANPANANQPTPAKETA